VCDVTTPSLDTVTTPLAGAPRPLREWLTTFHLVAVALDPYTRESAWILPTAVRVLGQFAGASVRTTIVMASDAADARAFLGPHADEFLVFADPTRELVRTLGLAELPALVYLQSDGTVPARAEGWSPAEWKRVAAHVAGVVSWKVPTIPAPGDPGSFRGSPALAAS
jgi:hypothetical protein